MAEQKLFMVMLGCRPQGRNTEQHDVFFGIGETVKDLVPQIKKFWPGAGKIHIDAWREVTEVDGFQVTIVPREAAAENNNPYTLFFLNLGGYKEGAFDEFHYKMLAVAQDKDAAIREAKKTAFYKHTGFEGAPSHVDDKFGVDVDEMHQVKDILTDDLKAQYSIQLSPATDAGTDKLYLGYFPFDKL